MDRHFEIPESVNVSFSWTLGHDIAEIVFEGTIGTLFGIFANLMLVALFLSPVPTVWRMWKRQSTEEFHPYLYVAASIYFFVWQFYSLPVHPPPWEFRYMCQFYSAGIGFMFFATYTSLFWLLTTTRNRNIIALINIGGFVLSSTIVFLGIYWSKTVGDVRAVVLFIRSAFLGPSCVLCGICMYGSPLSITERVFRTNDVEYLPFWPSLACFLNGLVWFIYGCLPRTFDPYIAITHGIGTLLGFLQLLIFYKFSMKSHNSSRVRAKGL